MLLPFVAPAVVITAAGNRVRYVPWIGMLGAAATAAVGVGDLGRVLGIGVVELIAAAAALLVSIASFSGMYRADVGTRRRARRRRCEHRRGSAATDGCTVGVTTSAASFLRVSRRRGSFGAR